jgi:hypothetical protein
VAAKNNVSTGSKSEFEKLGRDKRLNLVQEFAHFLKENKKWWLAPIVVAFAIVGVLAVLASTGAAPFIYTLF